jgi:ankyrin repeat protein
MEHVVLPEALEDDEPRQTIGKTHSHKGSLPEEKVFKNIAVGDMGDVITLVETHQLSVNIRDAYGNTLLHWTAYRGNLELTNYCLDHGIGGGVPLTLERSRSITAQYQRWTHSPTLGGIER